MRFTLFRELADPLRTMTRPSEKEDTIRGIFSHCDDADEMAIAAMFLTGRISMPQEGLTTGIKETFLAADLGLDGRQSLEDIAQVAMQRAEVGKNDYDLMDVWAIFRSYLTSTGRKAADKSRIISIVVFQMAHVRADVPFLLQLLCEKVNNGIDDKTILYTLFDAQDAQERAKLSQAFAFNPNLMLWVGAASEKSHPATKDLLAGHALPGTPLEPQLCARVDDLSKVLLAHGGTTHVSAKLDGIRCHVHVYREVIEQGHIMRRVKIFSRALRDITADYPEIERAAAKLPIKMHAILDGELVALMPDGSVAPFDVLQTRLGRKSDRGAVPVGVMLYDCLLLDDAPIASTPYADRLGYLSTLTKGNGLLRVLEGSYVSSVAILRDMLFKAAEDGEEGLVCKDPKSFPEPGMRSKAWTKLKSGYLDDTPFKDTYDLVVIGYNKGRGKRHGKIGALWVGIQDEPDGTYLPVCKVGTGLKDEDLEWFQANLTVTGVPTRPHDFNEIEVFVKPEVVVEVQAMGGVTKTDRWAEISLRFPALVRIRLDKRPDQATRLIEIAGVQEADHA